MKKMHGKLTALSLALILLWGMLPAPSRAQADQSDEPSYAALIAGDQAAFLLAFDGGIYPLNEDNEPAEAPAASLDMETQYPFVWGEALWVIDKGQGAARQIYPEGKADSAFALNITDDLAAGAEDWYLSDVRMEDGALYFLLGIPWQEYPELCRYRVEEKAYDRVSVPGLRGYVPQGAGRGLAISEAGNETLVSEVDWAGGKRR